MAVLEQIYLRYNLSTISLQTVFNIDILTLLFNKIEYVIKKNLRFPELASIHGTNTYLFCFVTLEPAFLVGHAHV